MDGEEDEEEEEEEEDHEIRITINGAEKTPGDQRGVLSQLRSRLPRFLGGIGSRASVQGDIVGIVPAPSADQDPLVNGALISPSTPRRIGSPEEPGTDDGMRDFFSSTRKRKTEPSSIAIVGATPDRPDTTSNCNVGEDAEGDDGMGFLFAKPKAAGTTVVTHLPPAPCPGGDDGLADHDSTVVLDALFAKPAQKALTSPEVSAKKKTEVQALQARESADDGGFDDLFHRPARSVKANAAPAARAAHQKPSRDRSQPARREKGRRGPTAALPEEAAPSVVSAGLSAIFQSRIPQAPSAASGSRVAPSNLSGSDEEEEDEEYEDDEGPPQAAVDFFGYARRVAALGRDPDAEGDAGAAAVEEALRRIEADNDDVDSLADLEPGMHLELMHQPLLS